LNRVVVSFKSKFLHRKLDIISRFFLNNTVSLLLIFIYVTSIHILVVISSGFFPLLTSKSSSIYSYFDITECRIYYLFTK